MKKILTFALVLILSLGFSITYVNAEEGGTVIDRVCNMKIDKASAKTLTKDGQTYYFCSDYCKTTFDKDPAKYACVCAKLHEGCNCGHCEEKGNPCRCAEASTGPNKEKHKHEHEGHNH